MRRALLSLATGLTAMLVAGTAAADYHVMKIVEVFAGAPNAPNAHYVQLQMYAAGQNQLQTHALYIFNAAGTEVGKVDLAMVANGDDLANVLIGTASVNASLGVAPDFTMPALTPAGGKVCFEPEGAVDCFSWGNYTGDLASTTAPFAALTAGKAAKLVVLGRGDDVARLDGNDDTDNSSTDFVAGAPAPKNNNGATGSLPDAGTAPIDASVPPADAATPFDSGVGTTPTPPREGGTTGGDDAGAGSGGSSDDSGCALGARPAEGSIAGLTFVGVAAMVTLSRRRRRSR